MPHYRKKPVIIEAFQWDGSIASGEAISAAFGGDKVHLHAELDDLRPPRLVCNTLEGVLTASAGDFIICGVAGEIYPCKPDVFEAIYEDEGKRQEIQSFDHDQAKLQADQMQSLLAQCKSIVEAELSRAERSDGTTLQVGARIKGVRDLLQAMDQCLDPALGKGDLRIHRHAH